MSGARDTLTTGVSVTIVAVWVISFLVDIFVKSYEPNPTVHALMLLVAGALFGEGVIRRNNGSTPTTTPSVPNKEDEL